jgi:hypothetical protein
VNVERLHRVAQLVADELDADETRAYVERLRNALEGVTNNPADAQAQQLLSEARTHLQRTLPDAASNSWAASDRDLLDEIGVSDMIGQRLLDWIEDILARNQMTPSVALSEIDPIRERLDEVTTHLPTLLNDLKFFGIRSDDVVDEYEVGVAIPRQEVGNNLPTLGKEFAELQKILAPFEELAGEGVPDFKIRAIASSNFQVYLAAEPGVAYFIARGLNEVLDAYQKLLNIKRMRSEMAAEVPEDALSGIDAYANVLMSQELTSAAAELVVASNVESEWRRNELQMSVNWSLNKMANRIDAGYTIDVSVPPVPEEPQPTEEGGVPDPAALDAYSQALEIKRLSERVKRLEAGGSRILELPEGSDDHLGDPA